MPWRRSCWASAAVSTHPPPISSKAVFPAAATVSSESIGEWPMAMLFWLASCGVPSPRASSHTPSLPRVPWTLHSYLEFRIRCVPSRAGVPGCPPVYGGHMECGPVAVRATPGGARCSTVSPVCVSCSLCRLPSRSLTPQPPAHGAPTVHTAHTLPLHSASSAHTPRAALARDFAVPFLRSRSPHRSAPVGCSKRPSPPAPIRSPLAMAAPAPASAASLSAAASAAAPAVAPAAGLGPLATTVPDAGALRE